MKNQSVINIRKTETANPSVVYADEIISGRSMTANAAVFTKYLFTSGKSFIAILYAMKNEATSSIEFIKSAAE